MNRTVASTKLRDTLNKHGLNDWKIRHTADNTKSFLGLCDYKHKTIILNIHHVDMHPHDEVIDTIYHEVAHALCPGHGHDDVWAAKAREIGCTNTLPCSHLSLPDSVIDAIRSGADIEMTVEEEVHVIRKPTYKVTRLQEMCPDCGKVAEELFATEHIDKDGNDVKLITLKCFHIIKRIKPRGTPFDLMVSNDWKPEVKNCKHGWNKTVCEKCGEFKLYNFQVAGARALEAGLSMQKGFGLFDDMGLGKTPQTLAVIKYHDELTPTLYVVKSAIKFQWFKEIIRWLGPAYLAQVISTSKDFIFPGLKSYIIAYDLLRRMNPEKLAALKLRCVVLDECQQIKNPDSTRTQEVRRLLKNPDIKVIPLSGTPWKNRGSEFFPVLNMMDPFKFHSYQAYLDRWVDFYWEGNKKKMGGIRNPKAFREYTQSLLVRREYNEVMDEFPEINRMKLGVQLDDLTQSTYDESAGAFVEWYNEYVMGGEEDSINSIEILAQMARMRHITGLAKIPATLGFIEQFVEETDKKLVVFVHHKDVGQLMYGALTDLDDNNDNKELAQLLHDEGVKVYKYTSELSDSERFEMQEAFNKCPRAVMIASTLACGEGVNLQTCADSILHERQWNPQNEDQATPGRFRRIGQVSKTINITVPEAEDTIDQHLDLIISTKRKQFHEVMNKGEIPTWNQNEIAKQLAEMIVAKHKAKNKNKAKTNITGKAQLVKR